MTHTSRLPLGALLVAALAAPLAPVAGQATDAVTARIYHSATFPRCMPDEPCRPPARALDWQDSNKLPQYSEVMRTVGISGEVDVNFEVAADGRVDASSIVITRSTNRVFDTVVREAVGTWRLPPWPDSGPAQVAQTQLSITFALLEGCTGDNAPRHAWVWGSQMTRLMVLRCRPPLVPRQR